MTERPLCKVCGKTRCDCPKPSGPYVEKPIVLIFTLLFFVFLAAWVGWVPFE